MTTRDAYEILIETLNRFAAVELKRIHLNKSNGF